MSKKVINTELAPTPIGPYSQAIKAGNLLFISGQISLQEAGVPDITMETAQVMGHLQAILKEAGMTFANVVKTTIFLKDMHLFSIVNEEYGKYFPADFPARETVAVKGLPKDVNVEISMIACE